MPSAAFTQVARSSLAGHHRHGCVPASRRGITPGRHRGDKITTLLDHRFHGVERRRERVDHGLVTRLSFAALHNAGQPSAQCRM